VQIGDQTRGFVGAINSGIAAKSEIERWLGSGRSKEREQGELDLEFSLTTSL
jgi:hypothetical protein